MKITGLVTCVGEHYAKLLEKALPVWLDTLDECRIVTAHSEGSVYDVLNPFLNRSNLRTTITDIFTRHGASFNKGAALSQGFAAINSPDWILNFDADILPPANWRDVVCDKLFKDMRRDRLYGCSHRYREDASLIPDADFPNIWGFFHLWNVADPHSWKRPVYDPTCGHAGNYDHTFMCQWPHDSRVDLWPELKLIHQGEPRQKWFGNDERNDRKMVNLFTLGLYDAWLTRAGHIKPPPPQVVKSMPFSEFKDTDDALAYLNAWTDPDPFRVKVEIK